MTNNNDRTDVTAQLHSLNNDYVQHVTMTCRPVTAQTPPAHFIDALNRLTPTQRHEVCATPYSLFHLPFARPDYWRAAFANNSRSFDADSPSVRLHGGERLVASALMLSWHLARIDPGAGRLLFGMCSQTLDVFRHASAWHILGAVEQATSLLRPRWPAHPFFWPELIHAAGSDFVRLHAARLLGAQMLAIEATAYDRSVFRPNKPNTSSKVSRREDLIDYPGLTL